MDNNATLKSKEEFTILMDELPDFYLKMVLFTISFCKLAPEKAWVLELGGFKVPTQFIWKAIGSPSTAAEYLGDSSSESY